jgi:hypothetical protein
MEMSMKETLFKASSSTELDMTSKYSSEAISELVEKLSINMQLTPEQSSDLDSGKGISLSNVQFDFIEEQLTSRIDVDEFLKENQSLLLPLSVSLFVINDKLWNMMERKPWDKKKMLAMSTIPLCTWDKDRETTSNPKGVKRWPIRENMMDLLLNDPPEVIIRGEGGDFSGFIEQSHLTMRKWGVPDSRRLVPNYAFEPLEIRVKLHRAIFEMNPTPREELDYDYSDHARIFFEHGFLVSMPGEDVILHVGKRKPYQMAGQVLLLAGKRFGKDDASDKMLLVDVWLRLFGKRMKR